MTKLTVIQVWDKLNEVRAEVREILVWAVDHGVKPDKLDSRLIETTTKDMREDLLLIRRHCVKGLDERQEKYSKIKDEGKAEERRR